VKTVLYDEHIALGGSIVDFAGWSLPVMYGSIIEEHKAVRERAALFDISHMGEILVEGEGAREFLVSLIPTRLDRLSNGKSIYSALCLESGKVLDDLFIFQISENRYYLVVNASRIDVDLDWLKSHATPLVTITDLSNNTAKIDLQGPLSKQILTSYIKSDAIANLERFGFVNIEWNGFSLMVAATGYTGESGYELYIENSGAVKLWRGLLESGKELGLIAAGLGARDSLRLEACYSLYGHEISEEISPVEGGIGWLISSKADYIGKAVLEQEKSEGASRELIAFELVGRGIPRDHYRVTLDGEDIGVVTSGCFSPYYKKGLGLALVKKEVTAIDKPLSIVIRKKEVQAVRVARPIYKYKPWK